ncbi:hypothetical protein ZIOFF_009182 [Zingiber officinale]|uniref:Uncharacterized protein n=1 Tax=Zingiber officinale TaxID=94328 RepID=A0A8J5LXR5_ZINOF|nr:hypothetical protein ZIOFF_009182 [Zingiber officinale]
MCVDEMKKKCVVIRVESFNSEKKRSGILVEERASGATITHRKGAAEMLLVRCSHYANGNGSVKLIDSEAKSKLEAIVHDMVASSLYCIAFAYKNTARAEDSVVNHGEAPRLDDTALTLLGLVGLKDPCRPEVARVINAYRSVGVGVKMITGTTRVTDFVSSGRSSLRWTPRLPPEAASTSRRYCRLPPPRPAGVAAPGERQGLLQWLSVLLRLLPVLPGPLLLPPPAAADITTDTSSSRRHRPPEAAATGISRCGHCRSRLRPLPQLSLATNVVVLGGHCHSRLWRLAPPASSAIASGVHCRSRRQLLEAVITLRASAV